MKRHSISAKKIGRASIPICTMKQLSKGEFFDFSDFCSFVVLCLSGASGHCLISLKGGQKFNREKFNFPIRLKTTSFQDHLV
jgi:hypothetical protein